MIIEHRHALEIAQEKVNSFDCQKFTPKSLRTHPILTLSCKSDSDQNMKGVFLATRESS